MTTGDGRPGAHGATGVRLLAQVLWNLRFLGLLLVGPVLGIVLVGAIFGLASNLWWTAGAVFLFTLCLFALIVRGEWRRLSAEA